jgi:predicted 3-demethylubiquinone-9 3-methyltransferase (glyoxalase superfamily)
MPRIVPFLWFHDQAEAAMQLYTSSFEDSRILHVERYPDGSIDPHFEGMSGKVIQGSFELCGQPFACLDGGPMFSFTPAISLYCSFDTVEAVAATWEQLLEGGEVMMGLQEYPWSPRYGWLRDRFGLTWQLSVHGDDRPAQRITPALMFTGPAAGNAHQAIARYTALFEGSGVDAVVPYEPGDRDTPGLVKHARFHLGDNHFMAMDSTIEHGFTFNEAFSLFVNCSDQAEIDHYWEVLTADGGQESQCGWLKDPDGLSWQIIPANMGELLAAGPSAIQAMMAMQKIDIAGLQRAGAAST